MGFLKTELICSVMGNKIRSAPISYSFSFWPGKKEGRKWKERKERNGRQEGRKKGAY
jgi:hypothetical protein